MSNHVTSPAWIVLKFGGSSVARAASWATMADLARAHAGQGRRVLIVVSALSGITDLLQACCDQPDAQTLSTAREEIRQRHRELLAELDLPADALDTWLDEVHSLLNVDANQIRTPVHTARVLSMGELLSSNLGALALRAQGLDCHWLDSRELLNTGAQRSTSERARFLSAECPISPDPNLAAELAARAPVHIAPGFIARNLQSETVLLGRGGSDTTAAYLGTLLSAVRVEVWSDVPGLFSTDPRRLPAARLLKLISYREAQELAAMGAKALHPRALSPLRRHGIPLWLKATGRPEIEGTRITPEAHDHGAQVKAIVQRKNITLIALEGMDMWQQVGFLADIFEVFKNHGLSVDLVSTSEANVTVTLDPHANLTNGEVLEALAADLRRLCRVEIRTDCASVSLVGLGIRTILHRLGPALEVFEQRRIFLVSQAANDLNLTFVVESRHADRLVQQLHQQLIPGGVGGDWVFGPSWDQLYNRGVDAATVAPWWRGQREQLLALMDGRDAAYVYSTERVREAAASLINLDAVDRVLYSMKANSHPRVLKTLVSAGLGLECVSWAEVEHARTQMPELTPDKLLFTPNFAPRAEYRQALAADVVPTVDNLWILEHWGADFVGREVFLRLDPGSGLGHHKMVRTAGSNAKFGIPLGRLETVRRLCRAHDIRVTGLHAHTGSGILHADNWQRTLEVLSEAARDFPDVRVINLGGGLGVPDRTGELPLDLAALDAGLARIKADLGRELQIWLEPGRFLVSEAGVLLARVTQTKGKGEIRYVGVATGMNSLIRPALYGAWHEIVNLSRLDQPGDHVYNVVGPICETGDVLGLDRLLPECHEGDVLLIANTGAYGAVMASNYNLREPAEALVLP